MERAELSRRLERWRESGAKTTGREPRLIAEGEPQKFMSAFAAAAASEAPVFLCDPKWGTAEQTQLEQLVNDLKENPDTTPETGWLMIPSGGSSGRLKFARHDQTTLAAAVDGFVRHFSLAQINAAGVLPLHHVSGLMAWLRCALTGGAFFPLDWKRVEGGDAERLPEGPEGWVLSLVPTQLDRLLRRGTAAEWLKQFRVIFLGGAPAWSELLARAAELQLPLSLGYGMTETAAMVTALRPAEFLAGARDSGAALPHANVEVAADGTISIQAASLFRGYYPERTARAEFVTSDIGRLEENGHLTVLGRKDGMIISGGEKVSPIEVEGVLRGTGLFDEVLVIGVPDMEWGQAVVAAYSASRVPDLAQVRRIIEPQLVSYKRPRSFVAVSAWPTNAAGKTNRAAVTDLVLKNLETK